MILVFQGSQKRPVRVPISHKGLAQFLENYFFVNPGIFSCYLIKNLDLGSQCWVLRVVCTVTETTLAVTTAEEQTFGPAQISHRK